MKHISEALKSLAESWVKEAAQRRARTPNDQTADALESQARELLATIERVERETATLTVEQYADEHDVDPSTVRRLCGKGQIEGAVKGLDNEWHIPRDARRLEKAS